MEIQPHKLETLLQWLQDSAAERQAPVIVQVRIAVTPTRTQLVDFGPEPRMATISF
jgi:hypothetical protein